MFIHGRSSQKDIESQITTQKVNNLGHRQEIQKEYQKHRHILHIHINLPVNRSQLCQRW